MPSRKFAVFILSHGRPSNVITFETLKKSGYTGQTYLVIDNEDKKAEEYRTIFGAENVIEFDKAAIAKTFDTADTSDDRRTIVFARNACFDIAKKLGLDYFVEFDDDYTDFLYRYVEGDVIKSGQIRSLDKIFEAMLDLLDSTGASCVAWSQGGDHMGGAGGPIRKGVLRKAMNSLFMRTDKRVEFVGRINEDVNTYVVAGGRGQLFLTVMGLQLNQVQTQSSSGGMTDIYLNNGTYVKSFYTVIMAPSCVKISTMGRTDRRFHHSVKWDNAVPKIISDKYKKAK